jgi:hypothetical protein
MRFEQESTEIAEKLPKLLPEKTLPTAKHSKHAKKEEEKAFEQEDASTFAKATVDREATDKGWKQKLKFSLALFQQSGGDQQWPKPNREWKEPEGSQGNDCQGNKLERAFSIPLTIIPLSLSLSQGSCSQNAL